MDKSKSFYSNGQLAVALAPSKAGYVYYPNGEVAIAISTASTYQNSFCAYANNKKRSLLLALNEAAVGFAQTSEREGNYVLFPRARVVFTKRGGVLTNEDEHISLEWTWKRKSSSQPKELKEEMIIKLSEYITLRFKSQEEIFIDFQCESIYHVVDMGVKVLREKPNYLLKAKISSGGHVLPEIERFTLKERTVAFNKSVKARRNRLNPKAENLSEMVCGVVKELEDTFDKLPDRMHIKPSLSPEWRNESINVTKCELPVIPLCGTETGDCNGFGATLYVDTDALKDFDARSTMPKKLLTDKGIWKSSSDIRNLLSVENPTLKRSFVLNAASGRYSDMIIVDPSVATPQNPTGMIKCKGKALDSIKWKDFKNLLRCTSVSIMHESSSLIVGLVMRDGQPDCCIAKGISELVNLELNSNSKSDKNLEIVKLDVSEDSSILGELGVKSLPTFIMINSGRVVYAGQIGGRQIRLKKCDRAQVLLIETSFKHQIASEKALKRCSCDTYLCLDVHVALKRLEQISQMENPFHFDLVLISEDVEGGDLESFYRKLLPHITARRTVVAVLVDAKGSLGKVGLNFVKWCDHLSLEVDKIVPSDNPIRNLSQVVVQKPLKASSIRRLLQMRRIPYEDTNFGLTPETLKATIRMVQESLKFRQTPINGDSIMPKVGIRLSAEDTKFRGRKLINSSPI